MKIGKYESHPAADLFDLIEGEAFDRLVEDVRAHGLQDEIERLGNVGDESAPILDGRNRLRACIAAEVRPRFRWVSPSDPIAYVLSKNLQRRHLDETQRAVLGAKLATLRLGANQHTARVGKSADPAPLTRAQAAAMVNVSERLVGDAVRVREHGHVDLQRVMEKHGSRAAAASAAAALTREDPELQQRVAQRVEAEVAQGKVVKLGTILKQEKSRAVRREIDAEPPPLPLGPFRVIVADPSWLFEARAGDPTQRGQMDYPPMRIDEICALDVPGLAHPEGAVLWLWITKQHLLEAAHVPVLTAWGFRARNMITWDKERMGAGNTIRNQTEFVILATRGDALLDEAELARTRDILIEARREHSRKPDGFYEIVERTSPGAKVELFARTRRVGWMIWGAEVGKFAPVLDVDGPEALVNGRGRDVADLDEASLLEAGQLEGPAARSLCIDCEHPECPGVPDCPEPADGFAVGARVRIRTAKGQRLVRHGKGVAVTCADCDETWIAARDPVLEVPCPTCGAPKGTKCKKPSGHGFPGGGFHKDRDLAAHEARAYHPGCPEWKPRDPEPEKPKGKAKKRNGGDICPDCKHPECDHNCDSCPDCERERATREAERELWDRAQPERWSPPEGVVVPVAYEAPMPWVRVRAVVDGGERVGYAMHTPRGAVLRTHSEDGATSWGLSLLGLDLGAAVWFTTKDAIAAELARLGRPPEVIDRLLLESKWIGRSTKRARAAKPAVASQKRGGKRGKRAAHA